MLYAVGIDPATSCGFAFLSQESRGAVPTILFSGAWTLDKRDWRSRAFDLRERLVRGPWQGYSGVRYGCEDVHSHTGIDQAHIYASLRLIVALHAHHEPGAAYVGVSVQAGKQALTGHGNATKEQSVLAVWKHFRHRCTTHDEADAIGIACAALEVRL